MYLQEANRNNHFLIVLVLAYLILKPYPGFLGQSTLRVLDIGALVLVGGVLALFFLSKKKIIINPFTKRTLAIIGILAAWQIFVMYLHSFSGRTVPGDLADMFKPIIIFCSFFLGAVVSKRANDKFFEKMIAAFVLLQFILCLVQMKVGGLSITLFSGRDPEQVIVEFSHRAIGTFGNPNFLGVFMASCAAWYFYNMLFVRKSAAALFLISLVTVLISQSRTSTLIAFALCFLILSAHILVSKKHKIRSVVLLGLFLFGSYSGYSYIQSNGYYNYGQFGYLVSGISKVISGDITEQSSFHGRTIYWSNMKEYIKEHPFIGSGPMKGVIGAPRVADNNYIFILYKYGLIGLGIWLVLITTILNETRKRIKTSEHKPIPVFILVYWIVLLSSALLIDNIEHIRYAPITFFLTGLGLNMKQKQD